MMKKQQHRKTNYKTPYRNRMEITHDILAAIERGLTYGNAEHGVKLGMTKTRVMYGAYLSHNQLGPYLETIVTNNLIDYDDTKGTFTITEKGREYIKNYEHLSDLNPADNNN